MRGTTRRLAGSLLFVVACSNSSSSPPGGSTQDPEAASGSSALTSLQQALTVSDNVFNFDPDLRPGDSAEANAGTMETRTKTSTSSCPNTKVTLSGTTLTIDFGPPPGCKLASGATVSGALSASVSGGGGGTLRDGGDGIRDGGDLGPAKPLTVSLTFTKLLVNAISLDGTMAFTTSTGNTFDVTITSLATNLGTLNGAVKVTGAPGSITIDGDVTLTQGDAAIASINFAGVVVKKNDCYPSAGVATTKMLAKTISTFDEGTASSGKYTKQTGEKKPETAYLAPYGNCPPGPPGPGDAAAQ